MLHRGSALSFAQILQVTFHCWQVNLRDSSAGKLKFVTFRRAVLHGLCQPAARDGEGVAQIEGSTQGLGARKIKVREDRKGSLNGFNSRALIDPNRVEEPVFQAPCSEVAVAVTQESQRMLPERNELLKALLRLLLLCLSHQVSLCAILSKRNPCCAHQREDYSKRLKPAGSSGVFFEPGEKYFHVLTSMLMTIGVDMLPCSGGNWESCR